MANVDAFRRREGQYKKKAQRYDDQRSQGARSKEECGKCGKPQHSEESQCPALKSKCKKCHKKGHWERKCRSKAVREVTSEQQEETYFLGAVECEKEEEKWTVGLPINNVKVSFKIDTGADATVIGQRTFEKMSPKINLGPPDTCFVSPGGDLKCIGMFPCTTSYKDEQYSFMAYVIEGTSCLIGCHEAVKMGLVKRIQEIGGVFGSSGLLKTEPIKIALHEDAQPYAVHTARRVPLPLVPLVKKELQRMEAEGIIEKVTRPTEWCAAMVPVLKPNKREVRICADLRKLNKAVRREKYVMPTVDEILSRLVGSKVFTSLDAASGFYQIPLHEESKMLTTFITPFGRYAFRGLPFGITSAPEIFQRKMAETLAGLEGTEIFMDDVLIHAETEELHNQRLM